jgi:hypothetical protein
MCLHWRSYELVAVLAHLSDAANSMRVASGEEVLVLVATANWGCDAALLVSSALTLTIPQQEAERLLCLAPASCMMAY